MATIASEHVDRAPSSAGSASARSPRPTADLLVEAHNLTKRYGSGLLAVDAINLTVRRGEVYGFLGPNGAGKTTTLRMLLGLIRPTAGTARVLGVAPGSPEGLARVGALIEGPGFYPSSPDERTCACLPATLVRQWHRSMRPWRKSG